MRIAVLALALLPAAALAGERDTPPAKPAAPAVAKSAALSGPGACQNTRNRYVDQAPQTVRPHRLDQEPAAVGYLGVLRFEDGCEKLVKVSERQR